MDREPDASQSDDHDVAETPTTSVDTQVIERTGAPVRDATRATAVPTDASTDRAAISELAMDPAGALRGLQYRFDRMAAEVPENPLDAVDTEHTDYARSTAISRSPPRMTVWGDRPDVDALYDRMHLVADDWAIADPVVTPEYTEIAVDTTYGDLYVQSHPDGSVRLTYDVDVDGFDAATQDALADDAVYRTAVDDLDAAEAAVLSVADTEWQIDRYGD